MALQYYQRTLQLEPRNEAALLHKARLLGATGKEDLARKTYEEILLHNPNHEGVRKKVAQYKAQ
jgi:tetratricopeptide (TPR) repeat protein